MKLPAFSIDNHVLLNIVLVTLLSLGIISIGRLPQEQFAEVPFYWVNITVPYPGASADDIERSVTVEIEKAMQGLDKLKEIQSVTGNGISVVRVEFDDGITPLQFERLFQDVNTRFSRVSLPDGTLKADVSDFSSNDFVPVIQIGLSPESGSSVSYEALHGTANRLAERMLSIGDVSAVEASGQRERIILVEADSDRLESLGIGLSELVRAVQQKNVSVPGGVLETGTREYILRTVGNLEGVDDFDRVIVRRNGTTGSIVHVGDLARVRDTYSDSGDIVFLNSQPSIVLQVTKVPRGDAIKIVESVQKLLAERGDLIEEGVAVSLLNDSTVQIRDSIDVLVTNAVQGLILLTVILFFFVGFRNALMTAFGIPVTFAITFVILEALGETLNSNTLFGLVLVLGMIVDHSIVLIDNSLRYRQLGLDRREAAIRGTSEVLWPIVASALTTMAAFLPLMILPGTIGKFLRVIPLVVTIALAVSTVESIIFVPSHFVHWRGNDGVRRSAFFEVLIPRFASLSRRLYNRRGRVMLVFAALVILIFSSLAFVKVDLFAAEDFSYFTIDIDMPTGANRQESARVARLYEERILQFRGNGEILNTLTTIQSGSASKASILVDLTEQKDGRTRSIPVIMNEIQSLTRDIPGPDTVRFRKAQSGPPTSPPVAFRLRGDDYGALSAAVDGIRSILESYSVLFNIEDTLETGSPELRIRINEERAAAYGLSVAAIGSFIRGAYDGLPGGTVFINNEKIDVVVRYARSEDRSAIDRLSELRFTAPSGLTVPFSAICTIESDDGLASIKRVDGKREAGISASAYDKAQVSRINGEVDRWFREEFAPANPGVEFVSGGEFSEFADLLIQILRVFLLGIFLIYAILGAQFKSYTQPFIILLSVPMAFAGVMLYLAVSGTPFSTTVLYAAVALAGVSVNDTIVLIDFINERRRQGMAVAEAVVEAASTRLRPILLTSVTTISGLLPTAIGIGGYSVVWSPMASTIIFGLLFSTLTALTVIPAMYGLLYDRQGGAGLRWFGGLKQAAYSLLRRLPGK